jgi:hypothetical protein
MSAADLESLREQLNRATLELQSLQSEQGVEKISIGNYLTPLAQLGVKVSEAPPSYPILIDRLNRACSEYLETIT